MWFIFFKCHNGETMFLSPVREGSISLNLHSDACHKACSATFQSCWFVIKFPVSWQERNIAFLDFYPIVIFGVQLWNRNIVFHCDKAIVDVINNQSCKDVELMKLMRYTVYPKKYAHGFCFAVLCCGYTLTDFPISIMLTSLALWQSNDCPSASKATLMNMDKYFKWIHYERLHNHNKAKHNKTVCIFLGIYCMVLTAMQYNKIHSYACSWKG